MLKKFFLTTFAALIAVAAVSIASAQEAPKSPTGVKHVIWIGSDGFGAHYVMVGAPSEMHGYRNWNSKEPEIEPVYVNEHGYFPDVFRVLKDAIPDFHATTVFNWDGIGFCYDNKAVDDNVFVDDIEKVYQTAIKQLDTKPTYALIYFGEPDHTGHSIGWGTPEYQAMLTRIDDYVGKILKHMEENGMMEDTVVYFSSDHGGSGKGHGEGRLDHMEAPFIIYGKGIKVGDIVFMYVGAPVSAILYKCVVTETGIPWEYQRDRLSIFSLMRIRLLKRYDPARFTFDVLGRDYDIHAVRGPRGIPAKLSEALNQ